MYLKKKKGKHFLRFSMIFNAQTGHYTQITNKDLHKNFHTHLYK